MLIKSNMQEMNNTLFSADQHYDHRNILEYANRPFTTVELMNRHMVEEWNRRVNDKTIIYHLGDVTLEGKDTAQAFFSQVRGQIRVLGYSWHHDKRWLGQDVYYSKSGIPVQILPSIVILEVVDYYDRGWPLPIHLNHFAQKIWDRKHYQSWHLFAHSHASYQPADLALDIGVDNHPDYAPFTFKEIDDIMTTRKEKR